MRLIDEEEIEIQKLKNKKIKKIIMVLIILLLILGIALIALITYRMANPTKVTTYIDGKLVQNFDEIVDFSTDENGQTQIKGDYNPKTEEDNKCYVIRSGYEVAVYTEKSKTIYKVNLQKRSQEYEECHIDKDVFASNGKLYASAKGIEKGYNVSFSYDEQKKTIEYIH